MLLFYYCLLLCSFYNFQIHTLLWNTVTTGARSVRLVVLHIMLPFSTEILACDNKAISDTFLLEFFVLSVEHISQLWYISRNTLYSTIKYFISKNTLLEVARYKSPYCMQIRMLSFTPCTVFCTILLPTNCRALHCVSYLTY